MSCTYPFLLRSKNVSDIYSNDQMVSANQHSWSASPAAKMKMLLSRQKYLLSYYSQDFDALDMNMTVWDSLHSDQRMYWSRRLQSRGSSSPLSVIYWRILSTHSQRVKKVSSVMLDLCFRNHTSSSSMNQQIISTSVHLPVIAEALNEYEGGIIMVSHDDAFVEKYWWPWGNWFEAFTWDLEPVIFGFDPSYKQRSCKSSSSSSHLIFEDIYFPYEKPLKTISALCLYDGKSEKWHNLYMSDERFSEKSLAT